MNIHRILIASLLVAGCTDPSSPTPGTTVTERPSERWYDPLFVDAALESGIDFRHFLGTTGEFIFPEVIGSGVAVFDYDSDGDLDIYALQGGMLKEGLGAADSTIPPLDGSAVPSNRLFRNELIERGTLFFTDVTAASGLGDAGYGMGAAVGDVDNDGDPDLFVSNFGANRLYENLGDGTFGVVNGALSVVDPDEWTTSASFVDYDRDGDLDLFATNYVGYTLANNVLCTDSKGRQEYCSPNTYPPTTDRLWRNDGGGRFADVSRQSGIDAAAGNGLGTAAADFDGDGDPDIYVANDLMANRLWVQDESGHFLDSALMGGVAYNGDGAAEASMGVTAGDFDADGDEDLFMTHLNAETNTLYLNDGSGQFRDVTDVANLGASSLRLTGFGTGWFDYDNDGALDLFIANGAVTAQIGDGLDQEFPYGQTNQLLRNVGGRFKDVSHLAGDAFSLKETSRGAAFGDIDNDGDVDVVVSNGNGPLRLLLNNNANGHHWLRVRLVGKSGNREGTGSRVAVMRDSHPTLWRRAHTDGSYLSASDIRVHFGLGADAIVKSVGVIWPSGRRELWRDVLVDREIVLTEGTGTLWDE